MGSAGRGAGLEGQQLGLETAGRTASGGELTAGSRGGALCSEVERDPACQTSLGFTDNSHW